MLLDERRRCLLDGLAGSLRGILQHGLDALGQRRPGQDRVTMTPVPAARVARAARDPIGW
jgi:hypothetical protein